MSKKDKLLRKFLQVPIRKNLTFSELETLLLYYGYVKVEGSGSSVKFYNRQEDNLINLHRPHPGNILKVYLANQIQIKLKEVL